MEIKDLAEARKAFLKFVAQELKITTADKLHDLIPLGIAALEAIPDKDRREIVHQIQIESKNTNIASQGIKGIGHSS